MNTDRRSALEAAIAEIRTQKAEYEEQLACARQMPPSRIIQADPIYITEEIYVHLLSDLEMKLGQLEMELAALK